MCNYVSPWTDPNILDLFYLQGIIRDIFNCIFISIFHIAYLLDKIIRQLSMKSNRNVLDYPIGAYRNYL